MNYLEYFIFFGLIIIALLIIVFSKKKPKAIDFKEGVFYDSDDLD